MNRHMPDQRILLAVLLSVAAAHACAAATAPEIKIGDSRASVISALGNPPSVAKAGKSEIMQYPAGTLEILDGKVSSIDPQLNDNLKAQADREAFEAEQKAKGLVEHQGKWITAQKKAEMEKDEKKRTVGASRLGGFLAGIKRMFTRSPSPARSSGGGTPSDPASAAIEVYKTYATLLARGQYAQALNYATGREVKRNNTLASLAVSKAKAATSGDIDNVEYRITSQQVTQEGDHVSIESIQTVARVPEGKSGSLGLKREKVYYRHNVEVHKMSGVWKVELITEHAPLRSI